MMGSVEVLVFIRLYVSCFRFLVGAVLRRTRNPRYNALMSVKSDRDASKHQTSSASSSAFRKLPHHAEQVLDVCEGGEGELFPEGRQG